VIGSCWTPPLDNDIVDALADELVQLTRRLRHKERWAAAWKQKAKQRQRDFSWATIYEERAQDALWTARAAYRQNKATLKAWARAWKQAAKRWWGAGHEWGEMADEYIAKYVAMKAEHDTWKKTSRENYIWAKQCAAERDSARRVAVALDRVYHEWFRLPRTVIPGRIGARVYTVQMRDALEAAGRVLREEAKK
jgi:hypothetical protein